MSKTKELIDYLRRQGLSKEQMKLINEELAHNGSHEAPDEFSQGIYLENRTFYDFLDSRDFLRMNMNAGQQARLHALDKLLERDKQRDKDGFPRKVKLGKLVKPIKGGNDKTIIIPTITEEKLYHWKGENSQGQGQGTGGSGDGEEGEVIGEEPLRPDDGAGQGAGQGKGGQHGMGADAYDIGRILTEQFELPNIKEKGKKTSLTRFTYDMTDKNRGQGQILDKKATLKRVIKTNLALGTISGDKPVDSSKILITPGDRIYRTLSREKDYESQALVFFVRDYSGSMTGKPTEVVATQHIYINSWLVYQYQRQVKTRFILHDTDAEEVPDFYTYFNKQVAGGTDVASAFALVNKIVEEENLAKDYNIYVFHGTDGDDWDARGNKALSELEKMISYSSRIGITIAAGISDYSNTFVEQYLRKSKLLESYPDKLRLDSMKAADAGEERIIQGIKLLIE
ncbi:MAG: DUF444 family protein [Ignavibacteria bacterium]|jgi:uncharacterized sporulation protein YeaH/YhbH (DUF444 family)|nr:DUF444 family protein [Ignavibacteria bacterium]MCU7501813.1 DUF444 family protein [Ignavibacteria bacterium]MCU7514841.1 DUF444 family protein [Ignavibacteria bacterium]